MEATAATSRLLLPPLRLRLPPPPLASAAASAGSGGRWPRAVPRRARARRAVVARPRASLVDGGAAVLLDAAVAGTTGYSQASYYTSLGLFVLSVPGLWSLIKRSVKSKVFYYPTI